MKKTGIMNPQLSRVIAEMGHTDLLVISDAGLPIPLGVERIDLTLVPGVPGMLQVLEAVLAESVFEGATLASELTDANPQMHKALLERLSLKPEYVSHTHFKELVKTARVVIRSAECTPYSNIILHGGVTY